MDDVGLSFLLSHPTAIGLAIQRPLALLLLAGALFLARESIPAFRPRVAALRIIAYCAVVLALAGLALTVSLPATGFSIVAAVDVSRSIGDSALDWSRRYLRSLQSSLAPGDQLTVLTFADSARVVSSPADGAAAVGFERPTEDLGTDLADAIDQATATFPHEMQKVLLLLTDGNETRDDSRSRLPMLKALGVRVDAATPPRDDTTHVRITRLTVPAVAAPERPVPLRVAVRNSGGARSAVLNLYLNHRIADSAAVEIAAGLNLFDFVLEIVEPGGHVIRCDLLADLPDTRVTSAREASVSVRGPTRITLATNRDFSPIAQALESRGFEVTRIRPQRLPTDAGGHAATHLVILEELRGGDIDQRRIRALEAFVRLRGGGLVFVGGTRTFGDRAFHATDLQRLLPVTLEPARPRPGERDPLALFLVIDRSNSMGFNSRIGTLRDGEKMRYAIKAGVAVVKQLKDDDQVGVIAFDSRPHEIAPLQALKANRARLLDALPRIVESGGTDFYDALVSAGRQLAGSRVSRRHIVLLTDGDTNRADRGEYRELIADLAVKGVSVTTIRIGDDKINLKLLKEISEGTGGSFHYVENVQKLPELMLRDTSRVLEPSQQDSEHFYPMIGLRHQLLSGTEEGEIPFLRDYAFSKPKPNSETLLQVARADRLDPILSVWRYGLGRVAAFTASPGDDAESWPAWEGFARFWSQMAFWTTRVESDVDVVVAAVRRSDETALTLRTSPQSPHGVSLSAELMTDGIAVALPFSAVARTEYRATTRLLPPGRYPLAIRLRDGNAAREIETMVTLPARLQNETEEFDHDGDNTELLRFLTAQTGGTLGATVRDVTRRPPGTRRAQYPLSGWLAALAIAAFFADVALRRLAASRRGF